MKSLEENGRAPLPTPAPLALTKPLSSSPAKTRHAEPFPYELPDDRRDHVHLDLVDRAGAVVDAHLVDQPREDLVCDRAVPADSQLLVADSDRPCHEAR